MSSKIYSMLVKKLDKQLTAGKISRAEWRDIRWKLLQAVKPTTHAKLTGL